MAVNKKEMKRSYLRILKFMLIGIIPNMFLYYFGLNKLPEWALTTLSILIFVVIGFAGEAIYVKIRNKQIIKAEIEAEQAKIERKKQRENNK